MTPYPTSYNDDPHGGATPEQYANQKGGGGLVLPPTHGEGPQDADLGGASTWSGDWQSQEDA